MNAAGSALRSHQARIAGLLIIGMLYAAARLPELAGGERQRLAERFAFTRMELAQVSGTEARGVRAVNPSLANIAGWISAVGAAVALNNLDGDGIANDLCLVDPRSDRVVVMPAPSTGARFEPLILDVAPLPYDPATMAPMGCLPGDLNEDGQLDLLVYYWGRTPVAFLREGGGFRPVELVREVQRWFTNAAVLTDLDGDGHPDLVIANYFRDGARILDAAATTGDEMPRSMSRAYNAGNTQECNDGGAPEYEPGGTHFFLWRRPELGAAHLGFKRVAPALPSEVLGAWTLALGAADLDGDLLPELYFANDFGLDRLLHNRSRPGRLAFAVLHGERGLTTPSSKVLGRDSFKGMGVDFADLNGDGLLDIYVSNIAAEYALQESHFVFVSTGEIERMHEGIAPYVDRSEALGLSRSSWGWDSRLVDLDNDGVHEALQATGFLAGTVNRWPELQELAMGNDEFLCHPAVWPRFLPGDDLSGQAHNPFYVRAADGRYYDIAADLGLDQPHVTRAITVGDVDGDGDLDFVTANQWEPSHLYRNECPRCGAFLGLRLRLPVEGQRRAGEATVQPGEPMQPTRAAIGAAARITLPDGRVLVGQVDGGSGHSGERSNELHFGLGALPANTRVQVALRWRDVGGTPRAGTLELAPGWHTVVLRSGVGLGDTSARQEMVPHPATRQAMGGGAGDDG